MPIGSDAAPVNNLASAVGTSRSPDAPAPIIKYGALVRCRFLRSSARCRKKPRCRNEITQRIWLTQPIAANRQNIVSADHTGVHSSHRCDAEQAHVQAQALIDALFSRGHQPPILIPVRKAAPARWAIFSVVLTAKLSARAIRVVELGLCRSTVTTSPAMPSAELSQPLITSDRRHIGTGNRT